MPNKRISELDQSGPLYCTGDSANNSYTEYSNTVDDWFLMTAKEKQSNEKISLSNFQKSVLPNAVYLKENQTISGQKTFKDKCYITKRANIHSIQNPFPEGSISGRRMVGESGLFQTVSLSCELESGENYDLKVSGDAYFEGNLTLSGELSNSGDYNITGDTTLLNLSADKDVQITGSANIKESLNVGGNFNDLDSTDLGNNLFISENLYVDENINTDKNINIVFKNNEINFTGSNQEFLHIYQDYIKIKDQINIGEDNFINISDSQPYGKLYVEGKGYIENINLINEDPNVKFIPGDDEAMVFETLLRSGQKEFDISLPKTFHESPIISTNLQHNTGAIPIPYILSDVTKRDFKIKFENNINDNNFVLHTTVMSASTGDFASNTKGFQRFIDDFEIGEKSKVIFFPETHSSQPIVNISVEGQNHIDSYMISGVNTNGYTLIFKSNAQENYKIHTISTEYNSQRIS